MLQIIRKETSKTGALLDTLIQGRGIETTRIPERATAIVSYGVQVDTTLPMLNNRAGSFNKLQELQILNRTNVKALTPLPFQDSFKQLQSLPLLGRRFRHTRGTDIIPIMYESDLNLVKQHRLSDFFTSLIPVFEEYRVWIYRYKSIAVYVKSLTHPEKFKGICRNHNNGFGFVYLASPPLTLINLAAKAIDVLKLDFGAVDIVKTLNNDFVVLEVNTAPGIIPGDNGSIRTCLKGLARKIVRWHLGGHPIRRSRGN